MRSRLTRSGTQMAQRFARSIGAIRANRFAPQKEIHSVRVIRLNRLKPAIRNFLERPEMRFAEEGVQFGNPAMIRTNQAFRANL